MGSEGMVSLAPEQQWSSPGLDRSPELHLHPTRQTAEPEVGLVLQIVQLSSLLPMGFKNICPITGGSCTCAHPSSHPSTGIWRPGSAMTFSKSWSLPSGQLYVPPAIQLDAHAWGHSLTIASYPMAWAELSHNFHTSSVSIKSIFGLPSLATRNLK